ncbi:MAG: TraB/GumN family protein [Thermodesulfovibrionaceae bacterium]
MIWEVRIKDKRSYLVGASHIFSRSFKDFFKTIISSVQTVIFEGPLDKQSLQKVVNIGSQNTSSNLYEIISPDTLKLLTQQFVKFSSCKINPVIKEHAERQIKEYYISEIERILKNYRHWMAFFSIWYLFLELLDWKNSIDLEIFNIAKENEKDIFHLETIEEQIEAMEGIPVERILRFFEKANFWEIYAKTYEKLYLEGQWNKLITHTAEFPSRCESIVDKRDPILFERMIPYLEKGDSLIVVGIIHTEGIIKRLLKEGWSVNFFLKNPSKSV